MGEFQDFGGDVGFVGPESDMCAEFAGECEFVVVYVYGDYVSAVGGAERLEYEQSYHTCADYDGGVAETDGGARHCVNGDGDGFDHCGLCERDIVRETIEDSLRDGDVFCEGAVLAVFVAGDAEDAAVVTEVDVGATAEEAVATVDGGVESYSVTGFPLGDRVADLFDDAGGFVAHDYRGLTSTRAAVDAVDVAAADAACLDADQHFIIVDRRLGHVLVFKTVVFGQNEGFHGFSDKKRRPMPYSVFTIPIMTQNTSVFGNVKKVKKKRNAP